MRRIVRIVGSSDRYAIFVLVYLSAAALSLVVAHILIVVRPESGLGERLIGPVGRGLNSWTLTGREFSLW